MSKIELGQFFTKNKNWFLPHIQDWIKNINFDTIIDPFAGDGDLLNVFLPSINKIGYDIDRSFGWTYNDSFQHIPAKNNSLCITNPPYLAKNSATRMKLKNAGNYFIQFPKFNDLYQIGLHQCFKSFDYGIAIIPETYHISSKFNKRIQIVTIIEQELFSDTDFPVIAICWGPTTQTDHQIYRDAEYLGKYSALSKGQILSQKFSNLKVKFNNENGNIGVICIDHPSKQNNMRFVPANEILHEIKPSNRSSSKILVSPPFEINFDKLLGDCNIILGEYRNSTQGIFMAPFKGNDINKNRRRRLDFKTIRKIIEHAITKQDPLFT